MDFEDWYPCLFANIMDTTRHDGSITDEETIFISKIFVVGPLI